MSDSEAGGSPRRSRGRSSPRASPRQSRSPQRSSRTPQRSPQHSPQHSPQRSPMHSPRLSPRRAESDDEHHEMVVDSHDDNIASADKHDDMHVESGPSDKAPASPTSQSTPVQSQPASDILKYVRFNEKKGGDETSHEVCDTPVYLGRLPSSATRPEIEALVAPHGELQKIDIKQGYAFLYISAGAQKVIDNLDGKLFQGQNLICQFAKGVRKQEDMRKHAARHVPNRTLFVVNFDPSRVHIDDMRTVFETFAKHGRLLRVDIPPNKNFAFVEFESLDDAIAAKEAANGSEWFQREVTVEFVAGSTATGGASSSTSSSSTAPSRERERDARDSYSMSRRPRSLSPPRRRSPLPRRRSPERREPAYERFDHYHASREEPHDRYPPSSSSRTGRHSPMDRYAASYDSAYADPAMYSPPRRVDRYERGPDRYPPYERSERHERIDSRYDAGSTRRGSSSSSAAIARPVRERSPLPPRDVRDSRGSRMPAEPRDRYSERDRYMSDRDPYAMERRERAYESSGSSSSRGIGSSRSGGRPQERLRDERDRLPRDERDRMPPRDDRDRLPPRDERDRMPPRDDRRHR